MTLIVLELSPPSRLHLLVAVRPIDGFFVNPKFGIQLVLRQNPTKETLNQYSPYIANIFQVEAYEECVHDGFQIVKVHYGRSEAVKCSSDQSHIVVRTQLGKDWLASDKVIPGAVFKPIHGIRLEARLFIKTIESTDQISD